MINASNASSLDPNGWRCAQYLVPVATLLMFWATKYPACHGYRNRRVSSSDGLRVGFWLSCVGCLCLASGICVGQGSQPQDLLHGFRSHVHSMSWQEGFPSVNDSCCRSPAKSTRQTMISLNLWSGSRLWKPSIGHTLAYLQETGNIWALCSTGSIRCKQREMEFRDLT